MAKFLKFIVNTIMLVAILAAAALLVPPFIDVTTLIVDDIEMETNLDAGDVAYAWGVDAGELEVGDRVLLRAEEENVYEISAIDGNMFTLEDKLSTDEETIQKELSGSVDKVFVVVPFLGYFSMALQTTEGLIIVGLSVVFVIILFILAEIWKKEESPEEEEAVEEEPEEEESEKKKKKSSKKSKVDAVAAEETEEKKTETSTSEVSDVNKEAHTLFEETDNSLGANIAMMMKAQDEENRGILLEAETVESKEDVETKTETEKMNEKIITAEKVLAMPSYTKEELLERAKAAGDEPELVMDEISGVTFLDYSDIL